MRRPRRCLASWIAYGLLGPDTANYLRTGEHTARVIAANGIRLVFDEHRSTTTPTLKSGQPGKTKVSYGETEDAVKWLWKFVDGAKRPANSTAGRWSCSRVSTTPTSSRCRPASGALGAAALAQRQRGQGVREGDQARAAGQPPRTRTRDRTSASPRSKSTTARPPATRPAGSPTSTDRRRGQRARRRGPRATAGRLATGRAG